MVCPGDSRCNVGGKTVNEKTKQKIVDWITVITVLALAFTAGVAFMWQYTLRHYTVAETASEEEFTLQVIETSYAAKEPEAKEEPVTVEEMIVAEAEAGGVDPELALAIAKLETGRFTSEAYLNGNNVGGLSDNEIPRSYQTLEEGVAAFIDCLETYYEAGLTTPEEIAESYCPVNADWAEVVTMIMKEG